MKNARNVNFLQVDNRSPQLITKPEVVILPSAEAFAELEWVRRHFRRRPQEGYFIWVKEQIDCPLTTCITLSSPNVFQKPINLIVVEKDVEAEIHGVCNAIKENLCGVHSGYSKVILKENSKLKLRHFHNWGRRDEISSSLDFILGKEAKLSYAYKCLKTPMKLKTKSNIHLEENSSASLTVSVLAKNSKIDMHDFAFLDGERSTGILRIRMVGGTNSKIVAHSRMIASAAGTGHVDCMGLLTADDSIINAVPELINKNKKASLTHEASVGRISEENLNYLRSRGLTENEAIDLIVAGFLGEEDPLIVKGRVISSEPYM